MPHSARTQARHSGGERLCPPVGARAWQVVQGGCETGDLEPAGCGGGGVLERLRQPAGAAESTVRDLDAPGMPDGAEHRLLVVPADPAQLEVVAPAELSGRGRGDSAVHQDQSTSAEQSIDNGDHDEDSPQTAMRQRARNWDTPS